MFLVQPSAKAAKSYQKGWTAGASLLYPINRSFQFSGQRTSTGEKISARFEFAAIPAVQIFIKRTKERGWGYTLGYEYIPPQYTLKEGHYGYCSSGSYGYSGGVGYHWQRHMFSELTYRSIGMGYCEHLGYGANSAKDEYWTGKSNELVFSFGFHL